jgi:hypothetical protein
MADITTFTGSFPEFAGTDPVLLQAKMNEATRQIDLTIAGALSDDIIYLLTAQKLARTPFGNNAKLSTMDGSTVYDAELAELRSYISSGYRLT